MASKLGPHIAFADDLTIWTTDLDENQAAATKEDRLDRLLNWTKKWRLKVNTQKTDIMCFTKSGHKSITVFMGGSKLEQVNSKTCLGLILDNNLNFRQQVELLVERQCML